MSCAFVLSFSITMGATRFQWNFSKKLRRAAPVLTVEDISNKDFILAHTKESYCLKNIRDDEKGVEYIVYAIVNDKTKAEDICITIVNRCIWFICSRGSPTLFRAFVSKVLAATPNFYSAIVSAIHEYSSQFI